MRINLLPELNYRKSPLIFDDGEVEDEKLKVLLEAARWAPSCSNNQPWRYVLVHRNSATREAMESALNHGNSWAKRAAYLVAVAADPNGDCTTNGLPYYMYNVGLSVMCLVIEAEHLGLRVHQMAGWDEERVKQALAVPENLRVVVVFALGYEADVNEVWNSLDERTKAKLERPRERKTLKEIFFSESYGKDLVENLSS